LHAKGSARQNSFRIAYWTSTAASGVAAHYIMKTEKGVISNGYVPVAKK